MFKDLFKKEYVYTAEDIILVSSSNVIRDICMVPRNRGQTPLVLATISLLCLWRGEQVPQCRKSFAKEVIPAHFKTYPKINLKKNCAFYSKKKRQKKRACFGKK